MGCLLRGFVYRPGLSSERKRFARGSPQCGGGGTGRGLSLGGGAVSSVLRKVRRPRLSGFGLRRKISRSRSLRAGHLLQPKRSLRAEGRTLGQSRRSIPVLERRSFISVPSISFLVNRRHCSGRGKTLSTGTIWFPSTRTIRLADARSPCGARRSCLPPSQPEVLLSRVRERPSSTWVTRQR